ncbi:hypothetical protein FOL47_010612 [Perkinsus chesapeaki]|uniref:Uncharacterized protein n=1 Tax=Perkinsus chesapeaki TaxID=330153 RepID=A0A7J6L0Z9_PERCH|nr:hypothetical protein FOL47_010612 [Perkinsus chesapeaki]
MRIAPLLALTIPTTAIKLGSLRRSPSPNIEAPPLKADIEDEPEGKCRLLLKDVDVSLIARESQAYSSCSYKKSQTTTGPAVTGFYWSSDSSCKDVIDEIHNGLYNQESDYHESVEHGDTPAIHRFLAEKLCP